MKNVHDCGKVIYESELKSGLNSRTSITEQRRN